jgi:four helix bundle protein
MNNSGVKTFRDLLVWQKAMNLVTEIYRITRSFPKEEWYGLCLQIRRCAVSIPSNIAEGYGRNSTNDYVRFLQISIGSLFELQTQIEISLNLEYMEKDVYDTLFESTREIERMLVSLINKVRNSK